MKSRNKNVEGPPRFERGTYGSAIHCSEEGNRPLSYEPHAVREGYSDTGYTIDVAAEAPYIASECIFRNGFSVDILTATLPDIPVSCRLLVDIGQGKKRPSSSYHGLEWKAAQWYVYLPTLKHISQRTPGDARFADEILWRRLYK